MPKARGLRRVVAGDQYPKGGLTSRLRSGTHQAATMPACRSFDFAIRKIEIDRVPYRRLTPATEPLRASFRPRAVSAYARRHYHGLMIAQF